MDYSQTDVSKIAINNRFSKIGRKRFSRKGFAVVVGDDE